MAKGLTIHHEPVGVTCGKSGGIGVDSKRKLRTLTVEELPARVAIAR